MLLLAMIQKKKFACKLSILHSRSKLPTSLIKLSWIFHPNYSYIVKKKKSGGGQSPVTHNQIPLSRLLNGWQLWEKSFLLLPIYQMYNHSIKVFITRGLVKGYHYTLIFLSNNTVQKESLPQIVTLCEAILVSSYHHFLIYVHRMALISTGHFTRKCEIWISF